MKISHTHLCFILFFFLAYTCTQVDDFDVPVINRAQGVEANISFEDFLSLHANSLIEPTFISSDGEVFEAYVTSSSIAGNIPFLISVQAQPDSGPGLKIAVDQFNYSGNFPVGRKIIVNPQNLYIGFLNNAFTLGTGVGSFWSIEFPRLPTHLIPTDKVFELTPVEVELEDILDGSSDHLIGALIKVDDLKFPDAELGNPFVIEDSRSIFLEKINDSGTFIETRVRSSANFSSAPIPDGEGSIVAVLDRFNDNYQLLLRDLNDIAFEVSTKVEFSDTSSLVNEGSTKFNLQVEIENPGGTNTSVELVLTSGDPSLIGNFSTRTLFFDSLDSQAVSISIPLEISGGDQFFTFELQNATGGNNAKLGAKASFVLTIKDLDFIPPEPSLIISEYIEGSADNKYLELKNVGDGAADLSEYSLQMFANGNSSPSSTLILSEAGGSTRLAVNETLVLKNSGATLSLPIGVIAYNSGLVNFNGDDAISLLRNNTIIDVFGQIGTDPGTSWTISGDSGAAQNGGLRRKFSVLEGNTNWINSAGSNAIDSEWEIVNNIDEVSDLGL